MSRKTSLLWQAATCLKKSWKKRKRAEVLTVGEACKAILRPTPSFKAKTFPSSVFVDSNFFMSGTPPSGRRMRRKMRRRKVEKKKET